MKNFKPGQEVVYREVFHNPDYPSDFITPKDNEIITIDSYCGCFYNREHWFICEYPTDKIGRKQVFYEENLHPILSDSILEEELETIPELLDNFCG